MPRRQVVPDYTPAGVAAAPLPEIRASQNLGARALSTLADRLDIYAGRQLEADAERAQREGFQAGQAAGDADTAARMAGDTMRAVAFNRGAIEAATRRLDLNARERLDALARSYHDDPAALERHVGQYRAGVMGTLPPDGQTPFAQSFDALAQPMLRQAQRNAELRVARERGETYARHAAAQHDGILRLAAGAAVDPQAQASLDRELARAGAALLAMGPTHEFELDGRTIPADPGRAGAFTPLQIAQRLRGLQDEAREETAIGRFRAGPRTDDWVDAFERSGGGGLRPEQVERVAQRMRAEIAARARDAVRARTAAEAGARPATLAAQEAAEREHVALLAAGQLDADTVERARPRLAPATYRVLRLAASGEAAREDHAATRAALEAGAGDDPIAFALRAARAVEARTLTPLTWAALVERNRRAQPSPSQAAPARARVGDALAPRGLASDAQLSAIAQAVRGEALGEIDAWRAANPNAAPAEDAALVERVTRRARGQAWERQSAVLRLPPGFAGTREQLGAADLDRLERAAHDALAAGRLARREAVGRLRLLRQWRLVQSLRPDAATSGAPAEARP